MPRPQPRNPRAASTASKRKHEDDDRNPSTPPKRARRKSTTQPNVPSSSAEVVDLTGSSPAATPVKKKSRVSQDADEDEDEYWRNATPERRERRFRARPPRSYLERLQRARTQRMYVVGHTVTDAEGVPKMEFNIVGTTGNIYKTTIGKVPFCNCPDGRKGNQCKHICYAPIFMTIPNKMTGEVLVNVLKAPAHLQYQLAFLSSELRDILEHSSLSREAQPQADDNQGKRRPIEGDCPICFMEFEPEKEEIVWCRAACGNNIHKTCFQQWAFTQRAQGVRCVLCRTAWQSDSSDLNLEQLMQNGTVNEDGYVNVASHMGLSGQRDYSTYHQPWVYRRFYSSGWRRRRYEEEDWE
ncbi:RING finger domain protein [Aspergillus terreus]|uniref:RING finger domain protein n=1 Tax=Aspergillus terreus TaxID=33178 RepID=A0A5M3Z3I6_ASPTE|nr:hypothetical protein ATETN484_0007064800 [Aspergillus terreus]GFF16615.1 RING finger domain protein [Aspergillus terreus]